MISDTVLSDDTPFFLSLLPKAKSNVRVRAQQEGTEKREVIETFRRSVHSEADGEYAPQPLSFRRREIQKIFTNPSEWFCALKTDGERACLFLCTRSGHPNAFLIFRSGAVHEIEAAALKDLFTAGTAIDGEIVVSGEETLFLAFDLLVRSGKNRLDTPYGERHAELRSLSVSFASQAKLALSVKELFPAASCASLWRSRFQKPHLNDGVIFTAADGRVFKRKAQSTIDVLIEDRNFEPKVRKSGALMPFRHVRLAGSSTSTQVAPVEECALLSACFKAAPGSAVVVECLSELAEINGKKAIRLVCSRLRLDKQKPNHVHTASESILSAIEKVSIEELAARLR